MHSPPSKSRYTTPVTNSADVILVVEQTWCNADLNLTKVVMSIDAAMNQVEAVINPAYSLKVAVEH